MIRLERNYKQWCGSKWRYPSIRKGYWRPNYYNSMSAVVACLCGGGYALSKSEVTDTGLASCRFCGEILELMNYNNPDPPPIPQWGDIRSAAQ